MRKHVYGKAAQMKKSWLRMLAVAGIAGLVYGTDTAWAEGVEQDVAQMVAEEQIASFFPGEEWVVADCVEIGGGEGETAAWGFVFALADSAYAADGAVRAAVTDGERGDDGESELYIDTATVVTGGQDTDSLVFRTFRGLSGWYQDWAAAGGAGEVVRVGSGDIRFAATALAGTRGGGKISAVRKAAKAQKARQAAEREALPDDLKALADQAAAESAAAAKGRWSAVAGTARDAKRKAALKAAGLAE